MVIRSIDRRIAEKGKELNGEGYAKVRLIQGSRALTDELYESVKDREAKDKLLRAIAEVFYGLNLLMTDCGISEGMISELMFYKEEKDKKEMGV